MYGRGPGIFGVGGNRNGQYFVPVTENNLQHNHISVLPYPLIQSMPYGLLPVQQWNSHPSMNFPERNQFQDSSLVFSQLKKRSHSRVNYTNNGNSKNFSISQPEEPSIKKQRTEDGKIPVAVKDNINDKITESIWRYYDSSRQTEAMYKSKVELRDALYAIFKDVFPYCGLYMVGSSMSGFATRTSDMDLCLMITQEKIDGKKEAVEILMAIQNSLKRCRFIRKSLVIRARVPILKFEDYQSGVECDLNINNSVGIRNTHLLRYYAAMDWRVRPLILFVKKWARFHDINDASKKTISSYSLCLMVLHYLQTACVPPVLDSVQKLYPDLFSYGGDIRNLRLNVRIEFKSKNSLSLGDLFLGFLKYYANDFNFKQDVASVRLGTRIPIHLVATCTPQSDMNMWGCLKIEGPESLLLFTNGRIDDRLLHVRPHLDQTLFQLTDVMYGLLVRAFLNIASNRRFDRVKNHLRKVTQPGLAMMRKHLLGL